MTELYDWIESTLVWGTVVFAIGLVSYLAYRQYLKVKYRRARRRHRARRAMRRRSWSPEQGRPEADSQSPLQQSTEL
jgi:hypothetical protein